MIATPNKEENILITLPILFLAINDGFTPEQTYATKIWSDNDNVFMAREVIKDSEGKEEITGYMYEPWHYRYVGVDLATEITKLGITYEEYYLYLSQLPHQLLAVLQGTEEQRSECSGYRRSAL